jgi:hypothetical protein
VGRRPTSSAVAAGVLLAIASGLGLLQIYWGTFVDESDDIATAALMVQGQVLYRDVFTQHFPFPYLWLATVVRIGDSIGALRGSLLVFEALAVALAMAGSGLWLPLGLTAVLWDHRRPVLRQSRHLPHVQGVRAPRRVRRHRHAAR